MITLVIIVGVIVVIAALAWWINVGSARRHWRQAHEQTLRDFRLLHGADWNPPS